MRCPFCGHDDTQVKDSRPSDDNAAIRRRRLCPRMRRPLHDLRARAIARADRDQEGGTAASRSTVRSSSARFTTR
jgi:hypothetical protein